jgi:DNA-directed RNA polymerase subunit L
MNKISPIKLSKNEIVSELGFSKIDINMKGPDVNYVIINSIKRMIQSKIPIFIFNNFDITVNTSVFNNNYIKGHVQNIPVWGIENIIDEYIDVKQEEDEDEDGEYGEISEPIGTIDEDTEFNANKKIDISLNKLTMYIDFKNKTSEILVITTDHAKFYYKEGLIKSPYKNAVQIVKLQPGQEIKMSVKAELGNEEVSALHSAVSACFFKEKNDNEYDLIVESRGQLTEKRIIEVGLKAINKMLQNFLEILPKNQGLEGKIVIDDEDHTLGNIISYGMQNHPAVKFCGYNTPHPLKKQIIIHYKLENGNLNTIMKDVVVYYETIFDNLRESFNKLL